MKRYDVLIVGYGGREDALGWGLWKSKHVRHVYFAPGNGGTSRWGTNVPIAVTDIAGLIAFAKEKRIYLTIVGPEEPLGLGIADQFRAAGLRIYAPSQKAAQIELSKAFAKDFMRSCGIRTAPYQTFRHHNAALTHVRCGMVPCYIKADGPARGQGAVECLTLEKAEQTLRGMMIEGTHGEAGRTVVIEHILIGDEYSVQAICSGTNFIQLPIIQDHKREYESDVGDNTGGMGTAGTARGLHNSHLSIEGGKIVKRLLDGLSANGSPFRGTLFPGLIKTPSGLHTLECNARFGDPETQVLIMLLKSDLFELLNAAVDDRLHEVEVYWKQGFAVCVIHASENYPRKYPRGLSIRFEHTPLWQDENVQVFHSGTTRDRGELVTAGGRVLGVTAYHEDSLEQAIALAYKASCSVFFRGRHFRKDIGQKLLLTPLN